MYKGHTRGVNAIRFSPDGRWIISGGEDNTLKLWDLTAGKLLHDFKCHEGKVQCIDFHPHEFLLATGSADKTVKFWNLETFGLLGSAGPETTGVRCLTFNPDGRTLLCGLHENLKVFSWEPIRCHDVVDVGWSRLSDLNIHEGKLLGCSHNQSCVGVWVVDISCIEPCAVTNDTRLNGHSESKSSASGNLSILNENNAQASGVCPPVAQNAYCLHKERKSLGRLLVSQSPEEPKVLAYDAWGHKVSRDAGSIESQKGGRMRSLVVNWDAKERSSTCQEPTSSIPHGTISAAKMLPTNVFQQRGYLPSAEKEMVSASDEDAIAGVMEQHGQFVSSMQSRSAKLQIVYRYWEKSDVKTVISAMAKMADNAVVADVISIMTVNIDVVTLDICTCLLPLLTGLLESEIDRHLSISLDLLLKVVRIFGSVIYSTLSASSSVGVDIEAEQRLERCNLCFIELERVKRSLPALTRTRVSAAKSAQEFNLALQEVS